MKFKSKSDKSKTEKRRKHQNRYSPDPGGQATFYGGHKITVLIWPDCLSKGLSALNV